MNQTGLTFVLNEDGLQASPLCLEQATSLYFVVGEAPMAQGEFGSVYRRFYPAAGGFKPCVLREVLLPMGGTLSLEEEFNKLCAVSNIPGTVKVVQRPLYSATHGYFLTEYVVLYRQMARKHRIKDKRVDPQLAHQVVLTCRFIPGESLAAYLANDRKAAFTGSSLTDVHCKLHALQKLCLVRTVVLEGVAHVVVSQTCFCNLSRCCCCCCLKHVCRCRRCSKFTRQA